MRMCETEPLLTVDTGKISWKHVYCQDQLTQAAEHFRLLCALNTCGSVVSQSQASQSIVALVPMMFKWHWRWSVIHLSYLSNRTEELHSGHNLDSFLAFGLPYRWRRGSSCLRDNIRQGTKDSQDDSD